MNTIIIHTEPDGTVIERSIDPMGLVEYRNIHHDASVHAVAARFAGRTDIDVIVSPFGSA